jgi:hypothetical protein
MMARFKVLHDQGQFYVEADEFKYSAESGVFVLLRGDEKVAVIPARTAFYVESGMVPQRLNDEHYKKLTDG